MAEKDESKKTLPFRPAYMDRGAMKQKTGPAEDKTSLPSTAAQTQFNLLRADTERPTNLEEAVYSRSFLISLRQPSSFLPAETVVKAIKACDVWQDDHEAPVRSRQSPTRGPSLSSKKWDPTTKRPTKQRDDVEQFRADFQLLLNKITIETFQVLSERIVELMAGIDDLETMADAANIFHRTALAEHRFSSMYADLCKLLASKCKSFPKPDGKPVSFRQLVLNRCQQVFEASLIPQTEADTEMAAKAQRNATVNVLFLCELFKRNLVPSLIIDGCLQLLLAKVNEGVAMGEAGKAQMEGCCDKMCRILTAVGKNLESNPKSKASCQKLLSELEALANSSDFPMRWKFLLSDVIALQKNGWAPRRIAEKPKTIQAIRTEAFRNAHNAVAHAMGSTGDGNSPPVHPQEPQPDKKAKPAVSSVTRTVVSRRVIPIEPTYEFKSIADIEREITLLLEDLFDHRDIDEALYQYEKIQCSIEMQYLLVVNLLQFALEKNNDDQRLATAFLVKCRHSERITQLSFEKGLEEIFAGLGELMLDYPRIFVFLADCINDFINSHILQADFVDCQLGRFAHIEKLKRQIDFVRL